MHQRRVSGDGVADSDDRRQQRLAGLGARVAEIGHELKIPLSLIVGSLDHLDASVRASLADVHQLASGRPSDLVETLRTAAALVAMCRRGAERLERTVMQLGDYARGTAPSASQPVDLPKLLRTAADLVARTSGMSTAIVLDLPKLPAVRGDESALERVFTNVLRNALEALANIREATVHVTAVARDPIDALPHHVEVRVQDNGPGIPPGDREHVFEPFFSRKAGKGLGLGLAIAREIVESNGGTITLSADANPGSEFVIRLPLAP